jgi:hypothetical protein
VLVLRLDGLRLDAERPRVALVAGPRLAMATGAVRLGAAAMGIFRGMDRCYQNPLG